MSTTEPSATWIWSCRLAGPLLAVLAYGLLDGAPNEAARCTAAVAVLMAVYWMTEAIPLPATSLFPVVLFPLLDISTINEATAPFANPFIFLFLGGFLIAMAVERWGLHERLALLTLLGFGTQPRRLVAGFMVATAALSMWISNTATAVMMLPIASSLALLLRRQIGDRPEDQQQASQFEVCLLLGVAYAASIGGIGTLVGTPPNAFLAGFLEQQGLTLSFARWMVLAMPLVVLMLAGGWFLMTHVIFPISVSDLPGGRKLIRDRLRGLGPVSRAEKTVIAVFASTATLWVFREPLVNWQWLVTACPPVAQLSDPVIAVIGALALFLLPVDSGWRTSALDWEMTARLPWSVLLLFGGGLSLADAIKATSLDQWLGSMLSGLDTLPTIALVVIVTAVVIYLTELTSNIATTAAFVPVLFGLASTLGTEPLMLVVPATLAASCAFMLPVATPPNAIVFGSGRIRVAQMIRAGWWLNLLALLLIPPLVMLLGRVLQ